MKREQRGECCFFEEFSRIGCVLVENLLNKRPQGGHKICPPPRGAQEKGGTAIIFRKTKNHGTFNCTVCIKGRRNTTTGEPKRGEAVNET